MSGTYAKTTGVAADKTRAEIERTLTRYGADQFAYGWDADRAMIGFRAHGRQIRFLLDMPDRNHSAFTRTPTTHKKRSNEQAYAAWDQACRQRWRALLLIIKAKLEAVEVGIVSFEDEFMAHTLLPDGSSVSEFMAPQIDAAYETGAMPSMLPALAPGTAA